MTQWKKVMCGVLALSSVLAYGENPTTPHKQISLAPADMGKVGPWSRKPADEASLKKELNAFLVEEERVSTAKDMNAMLALLDFPVFMITDDQAGATSGKQLTQEQFLAMMKPMWEKMPKDRVFKHHPNFVVLSDSLAQLTDDFTITTGGKKYSGKSASILVKKDGQWKRKTMTEAGWGMPSGTGGSGYPEVQ